VFERMFPVFDTIREGCAEVFTHFIRGGASSGGCESERSARAWKRAFREVDLRI